MLSNMPSHSKSFLRHSNCPSAGICFDSNLLALYVLMICLSDVMIVDFFVFLSFQPFQSAAVGTDGEAIEAAAGAAFEPIGVTVKNCNKLKRNEPGL